MMQSQISKGSAVSFPEFTGERLYMIPFYKKSGLPTQFSRWQDTVDQMLDGIEPVNKVYLMVDQGMVKAGNAHRRPGIHVDGNWIESLNAHGHGGSHYHPEDIGGHSHKGPMVPNRHDHAPARHSHSAYKPEHIILASDVVGCVGYAGEFTADIDNTGKCGKVNGDLTPIAFDANRAWIGNVTMLHESIPLTQDTRRTVVRLNVPMYH